MPNRRQSDLKPKVLIVDDNENNIFALKEILNDVDCETLEANSGDLALAISAQTHLALILLDVQMPDMDGFEVAELLKGSKATKDIPIIFVTAKSKTADDVRQGHLVGAVDYIVKPIDPVILVSKVTIFLEQYTQKKSFENELKNLNNETTKLSESNSNLSKLATHDSLTGLYNRYGFELELQDKIKISQKNNSPLSLMYIDLDDFKTINDTRGHAAGDEILKAVSARLHETFRSTDTAFYKEDNIVISRLGGDEFSIILPNLPDPQSARLIAERILKSIQEPISIDNNDLTIGMSIGISHFNNDMKLDDLCKQADKAMYQAKKSGKNSYYSF